MKSIITNLKFLVILILLNFQTNLFSQEFTTVWSVASENSKLSFFIETVDTTYYSWIAGAKSGSGYWLSTDGLVTINVSATENNAQLTLSISPDNLRRFYMFDDDQTSTTSQEKLLSVTDWGTVKWSSMENMFVGCKNLNIDALDLLPNLENVRSMRGMFDGCSYLSGPYNIGDWDVSNVTDMSWMFLGALSFNRPLDQWDVSHVTNMNGMFRSATSFNQPLEVWDVSQVTNMSSMFADASRFNQPLADWDVSRVEDMSAMFWYAKSFDQPIDSWNVSNVTDMFAMFSNAFRFDRYLYDWDVSSVKDMSGMFNNASVFNQYIGNWDVSNVENMSHMFSGARYYDQPMSKWDVSRVTDMSFMFFDTYDFNQPLDSWDVSNVTNMSNMFAYSRAFDQPLGQWDVSNVVDMTKMFSLALVFNQSLGDWKLHPDVILTAESAGIFHYAPIDCYNYSATLIGWNENNPDVTDRTLHALGLSYGTNAVEAREALINRGWKFYRDEPSGTSCATSSSEDSYQNRTTVYPNPSYDKIYISGLEDDNNYILYHLTSQVVETGIIDSSNSEISIGHLSEGVYILKIENPLGSTFHKVIKTE